MKIKKNIFELSDEAIEMSKQLYGGKIIKCLVAPFHTYSQLEKEIPFTKTTYLFPEKNLSTAQMSSFISRIVASKTNNEIVIVTADQNVILDMVDTSVRILTEGGDIVKCPIKTFMANIHSIRYEIFENPDFRLSDKEKSNGVEYANKIITEVNQFETKEITQESYDLLQSKVDTIGEDLVRNLLNSKLRGMRVKGKSDVHSTIEELEKKIALLKAGLDKKKVTKKSKKKKK